MWLLLPYHMHPAEMVLLSFKKRLYFPERVPGSRTIGSNTKRTEEIHIYISGDIHVCILKSYNQEASVKF